MRNNLRFKIFSRLETRKENRPERTERHFLILDAILGQSKDHVHQSITWMVSLSLHFSCGYFPVLTLRGDHTESCRQIVAAEEQSGSGRGDLSSEP